LWQFYLFYGILLAVGTGAIYVPLVSMVARWFDKRRGLMAGISISGIGFGIGVIPPVASYLIETFSWRTSMLAVSLACLALVVLLAQFLKSEPGKPGLPGSKAVENPGIGRVEGFTFREALQTRQFWMIWSAWLFYGIFYHVAVVHIVPYATDLGMQAVAASAILTIIGITGVGGRISLGFFSDRFGNKIIIVISFALLAAGYLGLLITGKIWMLYIFAAVYGVFSGIGIIAATLMAEYFGMKSLGIITGAIVFANSFGGAIGPVVAGQIFDITGSYNMAFLLCVALGLISSMTIFLLKPITRELKSSQ